MIKVIGLKKHYAERTVLSIDELCVEKGETVAIVGPNGSGKSTLLKILAGIVKKTEGEFSVDGAVLYLPQQSVPFTKTVRKNILFSIKDGKDREKRSESMLREMGLLHLSEKNAKSLSGGECQRLSLARVLVNKCDFLLLDEPSSAADIECTEIIENAIKKYKADTGCAILMTTHSPRQAKELADRIIILHNGKIVEEGCPQELLSSPKTEWGKKFIDMWKLDV